MSTSSLHMKANELSHMPKNRRDAKYMEHCLALFLGLTVQPCGEPCGSAAGFDFVIVEVIQIEKKKLILPLSLNLCQWFVACSIPG